MPTAPYRALRVVLGLLSLFAAVGGALMIFSSKPFLMPLFLRPPESEFSTLLLFMTRELGGFALMFSFMLFFAYRDPARNVAIIDAVILGLCMLAITPLLSLYALDIHRLYPGHLIWGCSLVRLALAALLFYLQPARGTGKIQIRSGAGLVRRTSRNFQGEARGTRF